MRLQRTVGRISRVRIAGVVEREKGAEIARRVRPADAA